MSLSKSQLAEAQFLHETAERASELAAGHEFKSEPWRVFRSIYELAAERFETLTGRAPRHVRVTELSTLNPAPWTKEV